METVAIKGAEKFGFKSRKKNIILEKNIFLDPDLLRFPGYSSKTGSRTDLPSVSTDSY